MEMNEDAFDREIKRKLESLDDSYPSGLPPQEKIWESMARRRKDQRTRKLSIYLSIAASLLLLTLAIPGLWRSEEKNLHLEKVSASTQEARAIEYVNSLCQTNHISCSSPVFKELKAALLESSSKLIEIEGQMALFGDDTQLQRAKIRIENHQARIIRAMVQTL